MDGKAERAKESIIHRTNPCIQARRSIRTRHHTLSFCRRTAVSTGRKEGREGGREGGREETRGDGLFFLLLSICTYRE